MVRSLRAGWALRLGVSVVFSVSIIGPAACSRTAKTDRVQPNGVQVAAEPDKVLSRACTVVQPRKTVTQTLAVSLTDGVTGWGVCLARTQYAAAQSWWKRDLTGWQQLGKPIAANARADQVERQGYGVPPPDVPVLINGLAAAYAASPPLPIKLYPVKFK